MKDFRKYNHIERYGNDEVEGIELGSCHIFPKLDGTSGSVWLPEDGVTGIQCASRNRVLTLDRDNRGFYKSMKDNVSINQYFMDYPLHILYGEWLVPHSLKTYRADAWDTFYIFDVYNTAYGKYLSFGEYCRYLDKHDLDYVLPQKVIRNPSYENLIRELEMNTYLIKDGAGFGEGIVIKNYDYKNKYGRLEYAKIVSTAFKEEHTKAMGAGEINGPKMVEQDITDKYITPDLVDKNYAKIVNSNDSGWKGKYVPQLLNRVYYDLINEELWNIIKKKHNPIIDFKKLYGLVIMKIKELKKELF